MIQEAHFIGVDKIEGFWKRVPLSELRYAVTEGKNVLLYDSSITAAELLPAFALESYLSAATPHVDIPVGEHLTEITPYTRELTLRFHYTWLNALKEYLYSDEFKKILLKVKQERAKGAVYPSAQDMFRSFLFPVPAVKCVWLGLSPYQSTQACGIAFAVEQGIAPPSLAVLEGGIKRDPGLQLPERFTLDKQLLPLRASGVLLLNSALTVDTVDPRNHVELWSPLLMRVIQVLNHTDSSWVLWGKVAGSYSKFINPQHTIYKLAHPSWYARSGTVLETDVFSKLQVNNGICFN